MPVFHILAPACVAAVLFVLRYAFLKAIQRLEDDASDNVRLPPGPKAIPLLGNVHQLPMDYQEKTFAEWTRVYGTSSFFVDHAKAAH